MPWKAEVQTEVKMRDFVGAGVKYREISLTPDIAPLFKHCVCDDNAHIFGSGEHLCDVPKNLLIRWSGRLWGLFHHDCSDEEVKESFKTWSNAPKGVSGESLF